jgi:hypothetical protein
LPAAGRSLAADTNRERRIIITAAGSGRMELWTWNIAITSRHREVAANAAKLNRTLALSNLVLLRLPAGTARTLMF